MCVFFFFFHVPLRFPFHTMSGGVLNTGLRQRTGVTRESENDASRPASLDADALLAASARRQRLLSFWPVFATLALANACSAFFNIIGDCDETYNYWEPTHYLVNDFGMQTWEYRCGRDRARRGTDANRLLAPSLRFAPTPT